MRVLMSYHKKLLLLLLFSLTMVVMPAYAQEDEGGAITEATVEITCFDAAGEEVNSGLGTIVGDQPTLLLTDRASAEECTQLAAELFLSQLSPEALAELGVGGKSQPPATVEPPPAQPTEVVVAPTAAPPVNVSGPSPYNPANTFGQPVGPMANMTGNCSTTGVSNQSLISKSSNATRILAFLPAGNYEAILLPVSFQTFDPILFVTVLNDSGPGNCSVESSAAREYVLDFSRAGVSKQVFGHISGGTLDFTIPAGTQGLTPVEILVGGQDEVEGRTRGEFMLLIEGAKLTPTNNQHIFNVAMTDGMLNANTPLGVMVLGVSSFLDPHLEAGLYQDPNTFMPVYVCEDAGTAACQSDARGDLDTSSVVEAQVRTVNGDPQDTAIVAQPSAYLRSGIQDVSFVVSQVNGAPLSEEYVIVFYGGMN